MSNMITTGECLSNVMYPNLRFRMSKDNVFTGYDAGPSDSLEVVIQRNLDDQGVSVTILDTTVQLYLGNDLKEREVKGFYPNPQVLQICKVVDKKFEIRSPNVNEVWFLKDGKDGTPVSVGQAPDNESQYWTAVECK
ncbi:hypothetical protein BDR04DRAFT_1090032 [Suillus decipiens]|nr:hypothetical protein BDR04DRAFT_1090032 [Suillus decipiens]